MEVGGGLQYNHLRESVNVLVIVQIVHAGHTHLKQVPDDIAKNG